MILFKKVNLFTEKLVYFLLNLTEHKFLTLYLLLNLQFPSQKIIDENAPRKYMCMNNTSNKKKSKSYPKGSNQRSQRCPAMHIDIRMP